MIATIHAGENLSQDTSRLKEVRICAKSGRTASNKQVCIRILTLVRLASPGHTLVMLQEDNPRKAVKVRPWMVRKEMTVDPLEAELDEFVSEPDDDQPDNGEFISSMESTQEWS
ncbi:hypothetical protein ACS0TY_033464 [Phlomoides rotata]